MPTLTEQATDVARSAARRAACNARYLVDNLPAFGPLAQKQRELMRGIWAQACPLPVPPSLGDPEAPFEGGQCSDKLYRVSGKNLLNGAESGDFSLTTWGPFSGIRSQVDQFGNTQFFIDRRTQEGGNTTPVQPWAQSDNVNERSGRVVSVVPDDGSPDECGNPPALPPVDPGPPPTPLPPEDRPVTDPDGGPDFNITFAPEFGDIYVDADANLYIPVNVRVSGPKFEIDNDITIPVTVKLPSFDVDFNINIGGGGGDKPGPIAPICCESPVFPEPPPSDTEPEPEPETPDSPPRRAILGVIVRATIEEDDVTATEVYLGPSRPSLWVPRLGTVFFEVLAGESVAYTKDYDVKFDDQLVIAPEDFLVTKAFAKAGPGVTMILEPVYVATNED